MQAGTLWQGPKPVFGLVGAIGAGKSTVAGLMTKLGAAVIDADELAQEALQDSDVRAAAVARWGATIVASDGRLDRRAVAARVFTDANQLAWWESIIHPRVNAARLRHRAHGFGASGITAIVEDCPLLLEKRLDAACDLIIFVNSSRQVRLERIARSRGWSPADLSAREMHQWPLDLKAERADYVIDNDFGADHSLIQVRRLFSQLLLLKVGGEEE